MTRRLYRSRTDKMIGGVAGGLAEYFDVDPVFIRIAFVLLLFLSGIGFIAYILLWILVPKTPESTAWAMPPSGAPAGASAGAAPSPGGGITDAEFTDLGSGDPASAGTAGAGTRSAHAYRSSAAEASAANAPVTEPAVDNTSRRRIGGTILIAIGILFLANNLIPQFDLGDYWPLLFIAGGAWMLWRGSDTQS